MISICRHLNCISTDRKVLYLDSKFRLILFLGVQLAISQHCCIESLAPNRQAIFSTNDYPVPWCIYAPPDISVAYDLLYRRISLSLISKFMGPTWGPPGADRTRVGPMLAPWTLLSGMIQRDLDTLSWILFGSLHGFFNVLTDTWLNNNNAIITS